MLQIMLYRKELRKERPIHENMVKVTGQSYCLLVTNYHVIGDLIGDRNYCINKLCLGNSHNLEFEIEFYQNKSTEKN